MSKDSKIEWCHHTFNPWWGCTKVSPGCAHCYAEGFATRVNPGVWGADAPRRFFGDAHWREPLAWNKAAENARTRHRVFCASMADVFEDRPDLVAPRERLWALIDATPWLDWLVLTKRPENFERLWPFGWYTGEPAFNWRNLWLGVSVEDQRTYDERTPLLYEVPAYIRFISYEPALWRINFDHDFSRECDWIIVGGESGPHARPFSVEWARAIINHCKKSSLTTCFVKQLGSYPCSFTGTKFVLKDPKGGDPAEWPADLRVREFPRPRR